MENYSSNSNKAREAAAEQPKEKHVEKVISGSATVKKKSSIAKGIRALFTPDDVSDLKAYIFREIVVPTFQETTLNVVKAVLGINNTSTGNRTPASKVSYTSYSNRSNNRQQSSNYGRRYDCYDYDEILFDDRGEAEMVLGKLHELIGVYDNASVADFYAAAGVEGVNFTCNKYGWVDLSSAYITRLRNGAYTIVLPKARPL